MTKLGVVEILIISPYMIYSKVTKKTGSFAPKYADDPVCMCYALQ
ncbi:hypothetical protein QCD85_08870 [Paenibacillus sp. PsM32]|nr:hypothetical protein [Paenibacillus sp. PsM32]MDN4618206.1 hypothetical protein [Paenibacillus sp. PsM32]